DPQQPLRGEEGHMSIDREQIRLCINTARHIGGDHTAALTAGDAQALLDELEQAEAEIKRLTWQVSHLTAKYNEDMEQLRREHDVDVAALQTRLQTTRPVFDDEGPTTT